MARCGGLVYAPVNLPDLVLVQGLRGRREEEQQRRGSRARPHSVPHLRSLHVRPPVYKKGGVGRWLALRSRPGAVMVMVMVMVLNSAYTGPLPRYLYAVSRSTAAAGECARGGVAAAAAVTSDPRIQDSQWGGRGTILRLESGEVD